LRRLIATLARPQPEKDQQKNEKGREAANDFDGGLEN
jgi:hypothetical protein